MFAAPKKHLCEINIPSLVAANTGALAHVIVSWGDRIFPNSNDYFGYNNDYTGFIPLSKTTDVGYLWVNHEYVSFP